VSSLPRVFGLGSALGLGVACRQAASSLCHSSGTEGRRGLARPVVICGPSGVGKGTLLARLISTHPDRFGFCVSHTTRAPRPGEVDGVHYHFCDKEEMEAAIARGEFLEHAHVHANIYGTSVAAVEAVSDAGKTCLLDIDVQGADSVKASPLPARFVFIAPPSFEALEGRLRGRGTEEEDKVQLRLNTARHEMTYKDREGFFDHVLTNDDLEVRCFIFYLSCHTHTQKSRAQSEFVLLVCLSYHTTHTTTVERRAA